MMLPVNEVIAGNCAEVMAGWPDDCIDLTVTSPPYDNLRDYEGYTFDFESIATQLWRITKPGGVVVWVVGDAVKDGSETCTSFRQAIHFVELGFSLHDTMLYFAEKPLSNDNRYQQCFEYMYVFSKGSPAVFNPIVDKANKWAGSKNFGKRSQRNKSGELIYGKQTEVPRFSRRLNLWKYKTGKGYTTKDDFAFEHPAMYPEALARDHILSWSNPGDIVLDPMCGSGTTLKMAKQTGRRFIGIDISENYCAIARKRVEGAQPPLFVDTVTPSNKTSTTTGLSPEGQQRELFTTASSQDASG